jgi:hypothetical protein
MPRRSGAVVGIAKLNHQRPNTRMHRTRSRASLGRSPVMRIPFGGRKRFRCVSMR